MKKLLLISSLLTILVLSACSKPQLPQAQACTEEAKMCPDGSAVARTGPNCEFTPCP